MEDLTEAVARSCRNSYVLASTYTLLPTTFCLFEHIYKRYLVNKLPNLASKVSQGHLPQDLLFQTVEMLAYICLRLATKHNEVFKDITEDKDQSEVYHEMLARIIGLMMKSQNHHLAACSTTAEIETVLMDLQEEVEFEVLITNNFNFNQ